MSQRQQQTIQRCGEITGIGFLTGADVTLRFCPAEENHGLVFQRVDLPDAPRIPATIAYAVPRRRRSAIACGDACVEMTEHVLAALAGLHIDNCLIQLDAPEPPGCDGSAQAFADALLQAGIVSQSARRSCVVVEESFHRSDEQEAARIAASPVTGGILRIDYQLDYGANSPIPAQRLMLEITPETFLEELAFARTFILESEIELLRSQGYGSRVTTADLLVFGAHGVIGNRLRTADECVRHKILDCLGDFALLGCDLSGQITACRSGHQLNRALVRQLQRHLGSSHVLARAA